MLAALISGATLLVLAAVLVFEAVLRLREPLPVQGATVIAIAVASVNSWVLLVEVLR